MAETWASSLDYFSSNQVSFSQKAFYKNVGTPQWNAVNLSVQANRDALGLGAELPSEAAVTYDNATGKIYADGSEICDIANPG